MGIYTANNPPASSTETSLWIKMLSALKTIDIEESQGLKWCWCSLLSLIECTLQQRKTQKYPYMLNKLIIKNNI